MINTLIQFHNEVFFDLYNLSRGNEFFRSWVYIVAERFDWYVILGAVFFLLLHVHKRRNSNPELIGRAGLVEGVIALGGIFLAWGISYILKISLAFPRPFLKFSEVIPLFLHGGFNSFPSGHATFFAALAIAIYLNHKKVGIFFIIAALFIGIARVIAGVHFPVDVVVGWILGGLVSWLVYVYLSRRRN